MVMPIGLFIHECADERVVGTQRYRECESCGRVLVNIDGLHRPDIAALIARESEQLAREVTLW